LATGLHLRIVNTGNNVSVDRTFAQLPVRIGRNTLNDLTIVDRFVSQFHAVVELHGEELMLRDLGSSNGTKVSGNRAPPHEPIALAPHKQAFSIGPLVIEARLGEVEDAGDRAPQSLGPARPQEDAVLEDSFITNINETLAFDNATVAAAVNAARAKFAAAEGIPKVPDVPLPKTGGGTLLIDPDAAQRQRQAALARAAAVQSSAAAEAKQRRLEQLALQGVREIARALMPQAGALEEPEDLVRFLSKLRDTIEVFLRCFIPLRDGYRQFASQMHLHQTGTAERKVETAQTEQELAQHLLDWNQKGPEAHKAVERTFADLMIHQLALLHAIMRGVKSLLDALSPKTVDAAFEQLAKQGKASFSWGPWRFKELWRLYIARHGDMDDGDKRMFAALFGPEFADSYKQYRSTVDPPAQS
jgi:type VI secretion system protein ImpI